MPALLAVCNSCKFRFAFDYDFRQQHCSRCQAKFDWAQGGNPTQVDSPRGDFTDSGTAPIRGDSAYRRPSSVPKLPGEQGHAEYAQGAQADHARSRDLGESLKEE